MSPFMKEYLPFFNEELNKTPDHEPNYDRFDSFFAEECDWFDGVVQCNTREEVKNYYIAGTVPFELMDMKVENFLEGEGEAFLRWTTTMGGGPNHDGANITFPGVTYLKYNEEGKIYFYRDFVDTAPLGAALGEMPAGAPER